MNPTHADTISHELNLKPNQIKSVYGLLADGATIPFIARYRKEKTGSLDEVTITAIRDRLNQLKELDARRDTILASLKKNGHLTPELEAKIIKTQTLSALEDIYLPYRPKRRTKATIAREKGLEPLALSIFEQKGIDPAQAATAFIDAGKGVETIEDALAGARDIIAEMINEDEQARQKLRQLFARQATHKSQVISGKETEGAKFKDYFDWEEPVASAPSHRILAVRRGEKENILNLTVAPPEDTAIQLLESLFIRDTAGDSQQVQIAIRDGYKRLLSRSMETEQRLLSKQKADLEAITVFSANLRELLLAPPLGAKRIMGIDPGFRTGCKLVCLDQQGKLLHHETLFPHGSDAQKESASDTVIALCEKFHIEAIAIGNGTAGRETESFIKDLELPSTIVVVLVNESGASIYSASETARKEFPDLDLTIRGAVSIGRRLMDPLAELVKIDPKSIGVGQYQHDVDQSALRQALDDVVRSCVNAVGVEVNRASVELLTYVSGLGPQLARNIVAHRHTNGPFVNRKDLMKVTRLGPKAFEQCAGFLRIKNGEIPLDASAVHPESYPIVNAMAKDLNCQVENLMTSSQIRHQINLKKYITEAVGLPTLNDILDELAKPGRDPRHTFDIFAFDSHVHKIEDLQPGMLLPGIVTNVTAFGAFVDIGVHQDGLVHISQLADHFVKDPKQIVKVQQKVQVKVLQVDLSRKRISLSMKSDPEINPPSPKPKNMRNQKKAARAKPQKKVKGPFHNPFAEAFKDRNP
jgi:uncharacterized protein